MPQMVILEPKLPKLDGFEVLERLRSRANQAPTRGRFASSDEEQALMESRGIADNVNVRKPLDFVQLSLVVRQLGLRCWSLIALKQRNSTHRAQ
jgi:DNA-binding response OmpR family regulator